MSAKTPTTNAAGSSTPAAAPTGSQPADLKKVTTPVVPGADTEEITASDIDAALGQLSEASKADEDGDAPETETTQPATAEADGEVDGATDAATTESAESETEAGAGDATAEVSGDDDKSTDTTEAADEAAPEDGESPKPDNKAQQRINELVSRAKDAEQKLAKANERMAAIEAETSGRLDAGPLEAIDTLEALAKKRSNVIKLHQWALAHPQGGELPAPDGKSDPLVYDADGISRLLGGTFELVHETLPAREEYLRKREEADAAAVTAYPWLKDTRNDQAKQVQAAIESIPAIRRLGPNYRIVAADALIGQTFREAGIPVDGKLIERLKTELKGRKPGPTAKVVPPAALVRKTPPAAPGRPGVVPARVTANAAQAQATEKRLRKGDGNINDLASSIAVGL